MKKTIISLCCIGSILLFNLPLISAQQQDYSHSMQESYGSYRYEKDSYVPERISPLKIVTFPLMVLASPIAFPAYYAHTKEPNFNESMNNYWQWIHYRVPYKIEDISTQKIKKPNYYSRHQHEDLLEPPVEPSSYLPPLEYMPTKEKVAVPEQELSKQAKKAQKYMDKANSAFKDNEHKKALKYYKKVLIYDPSNSVASEKVSAINLLFIKEKEAEAIAKQPAAVGKEISQDEVVDLSVPPEIAPDKEQTLLSEEKDRSFWSRFFSPFSRKEKGDKKTQAEEVGVMLEEAEELYVKKKYKKAFVLFEKVLTVEPENEHALKRSVTIEMIQEIEEESKRPQKAVEPDSKTLTINTTGTSIQKDVIFTQKKIVSAAPQVFTTPITTTAASAAVLYKPIEQDTYAQIDDLLKKGEKYYRKESYEKPFTNFTGVYGMTCGMNKHRK